MHCKRVKTADGNHAEPSTESKSLCNPAGQTQAREGTGTTPKGNRIQAIYSEPPFGQQLTNHRKDILGMIGVPLELLLPEISIHVQCDTGVFAGSFERE